MNGIDMPWGIAFLPDGDMLVTELSGQLRLIREGELQPQPVAGVPESYYAGQGGLMDILLHPDFAPISSFICRWLSGSGMLMRCV